MKLIIPAFEQHCRVSALDVTCDEATTKITSRLTRDVFYVPGRERHSAETRRRMAEVLRLAYGFDVGTGIGLHRDRPRCHAAPTN